MTVLGTSAGFDPPPPLTLVTGATGWLGSALVHALTERTGSVRCLVQTELEGAELAVHSTRVEPVVGDVRDPTALDRLFDGAEGASVFHTAAVIHPTHGVRELFDVNVGGTALVVDRVRRTGARRLVHVSSNSPFGTNASPDEAFDVDAPFDPYMAYGRSKMEAEQLVRRHVATGDIEAVVIRPPWFYGPGQPRRQSRFFALVRRGIFPLCGDGTNRRSLVYVDDLVQAMLLAELRQGVSGRAYWVADARPYTMTEIIEAVRVALASCGLEVRPQRVRLPSLLADVAERVDRWLQARGSYAQQLHVLSEMNKTIACSIEAARADLGFEPSVGLAEGMRRSVAWCLDRGDPL